MYIIYIYLYKQIIYNIYIYIYSTYIYIYTYTYIYIYIYIYIVCKVIKGKKYKIVYRVLYITQMLPFPHILERYFRT